MAKKKSILKQIAEGFTNQQKAGIFMFILAFIAPRFLFQQSQCSWYNLFCQAGNVASGSSAFLLTIALVGVGVFLIVTGRKR